MKIGSCMLKLQQATDRKWYVAWPVR